MIFHGHRSAVKYGGEDQGSRLGSVRLGYQTISDLTLHQWFPNTETAAKEIYFMHIYSFVYRLFTLYMKG